MQHCVVEGTGRANITDHYNVRSLASRGARARAPPYARRARARADAERVPAPPPRAQVRETNVIGWGRFSAIVLVASDERRRLTLEALASTRYLPPSTRWDALQHRELLPLVETVAAALDSELKRLRAMQSLKSM